MRGIPCAVDQRMSAPNDDANSRGGQHSRLTEGTMHRRYASHRYWIAQHAASE